ncbi:MAG TPA: hypothetical protein VE077_05715 [Candidatus Methylomirabilis sp.]|nr:hypothetical protein [Candidatus Methylomirabilis sp.]
MWYRRVSLIACGLLVAGCQSHPLTDYRPLDQAGIWSSDIEQLKSLHITDSEVAQVARAKQSGVSDDTCVELVSAAHAHQHPFLSGDSAARLAGAGFSDKQIIDIAHADKLDSVSVDAVTLKLIGLSDATVEVILHRHLAGLPVMDGPEIGKLKNTGLTERQILERINAGMTNAQAEKEIRTRVAVRNHSNTSFVRVRGRRPN